MSDAKLKQELLYMVKLADKYDLTNKEIVDVILQEDADKQILSSIFGKRFKGRIKDLAENNSCDDSCIICGRAKAGNGVICASCMKSIGDSFFAHHINEVKTVKNGHSKAFSRPSQETELEIDKKTETEIGQATAISTDSICAVDKIASCSPKIHLSAKLKKIIAIFLLVILSIAAACQIWILCLYMTIPDRNLPMDAKVSAYEAEPVATEEEALAALQLDFPEEEGYTVTFCRMDREYVGAFSTEIGQSVLTDTSALSDEELYDYYMTDTVYIFTISYLQDYTARLGLAWVNTDGQILIQGSFNDGRDCNLQYRFR